MPSWEQIKEDFPIFHNLGENFTYLDSAATSQKPLSVINSVSDFYTKHNSNIRRGIYMLSEESTNLYEKSRENISRFIGSTDPRQIVFVRNTTEALNLLAYSLGRNMKSGEEILLTIMEHHSNIVPWQFLQEKGIRIRYADIGEDGVLDMESLSSMISRKTRIVSVTHVSNVLGTINPVAEIGKIAHDNGSIFIVDGAQSVPHMPVDVDRIGCDFMAFSGHKMLGPTGIGCLYGRLDLLEEMHPFMGGGEMIREVYKDHSTWADVPEKFEAGTPDISGAIGLSAAVDYLRNLGMENVMNHGKELIRLTLSLEEELHIPGLISYGPRDLNVRGPVYAFNIGNIHPMSVGDSLADHGIGIGTVVHPHDVASTLDMDGVAVRSGHHCAMPLTHRLNAVATSRASYYVYNNAEDVRRLFQSLEHTVKAYSR